jgi:DNA-binding NarL/FixJ family response regulator
MTEGPNVNIKSRVILAEDHDLLRNGLRSMLSAQSDYEVVGEARDGKEACQLAISLAPDLILMDLSMRGMSGIDATAAIKRRAPHVRIIALTVHQSEEYVREALRAGVDGYVLKDVSFEELLFAMRSVMHGKKHLSADVYGFMVDSFVTGREIAAPKKAWDLLTARERSVLKLIAEGRTNRQVGQYLNLSPKTIEKYRASLMHKLAIDNVTELVLAAIRMGLLTSLASKCAEPEPDDRVFRLPVEDAPAENLASEAPTAALPSMTGTEAG